MKKSLGVLLHVSSLKSDYGIGDFGKSALDFIDFLSRNKIDIWQILPLTETGKTNCPYSSICSFAFDTMFVSPDDLVKRKLIKKEELKNLKQLKGSTEVNYNFIKKEKLRLLNLAFNNLDKTLIDKIKQEQIKNIKLNNYAIFKVLTNTFGEDWRKIPFEINDCNKEYTQFCKEHEKEILKYVFYQCILNEQWKNILKYANEHNVKILGDIPIYPHANSFDVFFNPEFYILDENKNPTVYGGVPADDFNKDGQCWGSCVYNWQNLKKINYSYLIEKFKINFNNYNLIRMDHFIGYVQHWEVDAKSKIALNGSWQESGGVDFFEELKKYVNLKNIVVEDLGLSLPSVNKVRDKFFLTGMSVLQFANCNDNKRYLPNFVEKNSIYYLGTHDNNTFLGFLNGLTKKEKTDFLTMLNISKRKNKDICIECIKQLLASKSNTIILQMQDYLLQDQRYRTNVPGQAFDCWKYRVPAGYKKTFVNNVTKIFS